MMPRAIMVVEARLIALGITLVLATTATAQNANPDAGVEANAEPTGEADPPDSEAREPLDPTEERARRHFEQGVALFSDGNVEAALLEFRTAYETRQLPGLLYNIGVAERSLHRYADAIASFRQYLTESEDTLENLEARASALAAIEELLAVVAEVTVTVSPAEANADIFIDGKLVGRSPLPDSLRLNAGQHEVEVRSDGYRTYRAVLEVRGLQQVEQHVDLEPWPRPGQSSTPRWYRRWWVWTIAGLVVAGATATAIAVPLVRDADAIDLGTVRVVHEEQR